VNVPAIQRGTTAEIGLLGTAPGAEVADALAKSIHAVQKKRQANGIPPRESGWSEARGRPAGDRHCDACASCASYPSAREALSEG
jgi:hypothetical protein